MASFVGTSVLSRFEPASFRDGVTYARLRLRVGRAAASVDTQGLFRLAREYGVTFMNFGTAVESVLSNGSQHKRIAEA